MHYLAMMIYSLRKSQVVRGHLLFRATHLTSLPPKNAKLAAEFKTKKAADSSSPATGLSAQAQIQGFASPPRDGYAFSGQPD